MEEEGGVAAREHLEHAGVLVEDGRQRARQRGGEGAVEAAGLVLVTDGGEVNLPAATLLALEGLAEAQLCARGEENSAAVQWR